MNMIFLIRRQYSYVFKLVSTKFFLALERQPVLAEP